MKRKLLIIAAAFVMVGGLWWQLTDRNTDTANSQPADTVNVQGDATSDAAAGPETTDYEDYLTENDTGADDSASTAETGGTVNADSLATDEEINTCRPVQEGFGIEMKDWGKVRLPYGDVWPKNTPGTPVDCSPDSDFGAAVVAAQSLYLESLSPELIPLIAVDTPGRQLRIDNHAGKTDPVDGDNVCQPLGWDKSGSSIWKIFHQCEGSTLDVTPVRMRRVADDWLMVYEFDGRIRIGKAEPGAEYFPFEGGD